jgi:hypothetical protein
MQQSKLPIIGVIAGLAATIYASSWAFKKIFRQKPKQSISKIISKHESSISYTKGLIDGNAGILEASEEQYNINHHKIILMHFHELKSKYDIMLEEIKENHCDKN